MHIEKKYLSLPLAAQLEITDFCNHKCIHCYNLDSNVENRPARKVSDETVIACAQKLIDNKIFTVVITGGEPLIKKDLTKDVITRLCANNIKVSLNSNITLFDDEFIEFLKQSKVGVLTSCPSAIPSSFGKLTGTDNYVAFENNLKKLVNAGIRFTVNMVVTKDNLNEIRSTAERLKQLGCRSFAATPMGLNVDYPRFDLLLTTNEVQKVIADLLWAEEILGLKVDVLEALPKCLFSDKILSEKHAFLNRKCQAGRTGIAVSCSGDVRPCAHNPTTYGNILQEDIKSVWAKMSDWRSSQYVPEDCKECTWVNRCNGGCRTSAKTIHGEWSSKDMWATKPIKTMPPKQNNPILLSTDTKLKINHDFLHRQEDENAVLVYNTNNDIYFMISQAYHDFIVELQKYDVITYNELLQKYETNVEDKHFRDVVSFLVQKNMLKIV